MSQNDFFDVDNQKIPSRQNHQIRHIVIESKLLILFRKHQTELFSFSDDFFAGENENFF